VSRQFLRAPPATVVPLEEMPEMASMDPKCRKPVLSSGGRRTLARANQLNVTDHRIEEPWHIDQF
jgi:hypothetical protein